MPKDLKTNVIIQHQTKGFDKVRQNSDKLTYTLGKIKSSLISLKKEYKDSADAIRDLIKAQQDQARETEKQARKSSGKGAFTQGLLQGGAPIPSVFLQRGPGMGRQVAGMAVGSMLRSGAAGLGGSFTGVQGLQQFLSSIPLAGGLLAGQVGRLAGYSEQNINFQRTKLEAAPYLSTFGELQNRRRYNAIKGSRESLDIKDFETEKENAVRELSIKSANKQYKIREDAINKTLKEIPKDEGVLDSFLGLLTGKTATDVITAVSKGLKDSQKNIDNVRKEADKEYYNLQKTYEEEIKTKPQRLKKLHALEIASRSTLSKPLNIEGAGLDLLGANKEEATRLFSMMMQSGGGVGTEQQARGILRPAFAAKTMYGIQTPIAGAFLKAGRRGGLIGSGQAGKDFQDSIYSGILLGLKGSEINTWMQQIANGINQFTQTGIQINVDSISKLATDIGKSGLSGTRAINTAQGISQYIQGIGSKGITSGADVIMMKVLGGFKGGGIEDYRRARSSLEELQFGVQGKGVKGISGSSGISKALNEYLKMIGGGQGTKAEMLQRLLQSWGVKGSVKEFDWLAATLTGAPITKEQALGIKGFEKTQMGGITELTDIKKAGGLESAASKIVMARAPNVKAMASIQNQQIAVGGKVVGVMQLLERNAMKTSSTFADLAKGPLLDVSNAMGEVASKAMEVAQAFKGLIGSGVSASGLLF